MDNLGAILGPLAAVALVALVGTRWAIGLSVIPGLAAAAAIVYAIRRTSVARNQERRPLRIHVRPVLTPGLRPLFAGITAFEVGNCAGTLLILRATELLEPGRGDDSATAAALGLSVAYNAAATLASLAAGRRADSAGATPVLTVGVAAFAVAYLVFTRDTTNWVALLPAFLLAGVGIGRLHDDDDLTAHLQTELLSCHTGYRRGHHLATRQTNLTFARGHRRCVGCARARRPHQHRVTRRIRRRCPIGPPVCPWEDEHMRITRQIIVFDAADLATESRFWAEMLGGTVEADDDWHSVRVDGEWRLGVQLAPDHVPPDWPDGTPQQIHLDLWVDDLSAAHEEAVSLGARLLKRADDLQAVEGFQVYADPAGHPFCLCWG